MIDVRGNKKEISSPAVKKTNLAIRSSLSLSAASVKNTVQQANNFAYKATVRQTGNLAARGAVKAKLTYNNLKNRKFKNEGAYNPVRGSLFNKIKGVCENAKKYDAFYSSPLNSAYSPNSNCKFIIQNTGSNCIKKDIDIPFILGSIGNNTKETLIEDFITSNKLTGVVDEIGEGIINSTGITIPRLGGAVYISPFSKGVDYISKSAQGFVSWASKGNIISKIGKGTLIGTTISTIGNLLEGKTIGESISEAGVKSLATTVISTAVVTLFSLEALPVIGVGIISGVVIDDIYDNNFLGIRDITESIGNFIDNPIKVINELLDSSEFKIDSIKFVP